MNASDEGELINYSVEVFQESDFGLLAELHGFLMPRKRGDNERYLRHKYFENPIIQDPIITVVRNEGRFVAMAGLMGMAWKANSAREVEVVPQIDDLVVHPDHRRRGLTALLARGVYQSATDRGYRAIVSLSGGDASNALGKAVGWFEVRELKRMYLIRDNAAVPMGRNLPGVRHAAPRVQKLVRSLGFWTAVPPPDDRIDPWVELVPGSNPRITVSAEGDFEAMQDLASRVDGHSSVRTAEALRWRLGNPDRSYRFVYWTDTQLRGYMIIGWTGEDRQRTMVVDHCYEEESVFAELLEAVTRIPRGDVEMMVSTLPQPETDLAYDLGFRLDPENIFGVRRFLLWSIPSNEPDNGEPSIAESAGSWRIDLLDTLQA